MVVGLTGGIGSGKSTIAALFDKYENIAIYNADVEAKRIMNDSEVLKEKITHHFGDQAYTEGKLNNKFLASIVFNDKKQLEVLNQMVHPIVYQDLNDFIAKHHTATYILYENAILFENASNNFCDIIITVVADLESRITRVMQRDACSREEVLVRIGKQWLEEKKSLQSNYIILNEDITKVESEIEQIHNNLTKKASIN